MDELNNVIQLTPDNEFRKPLPKLQKCKIGHDGQIKVNNLSAYWIPKLTVTEEISGTVYTVTGSYEGEQSFLRKLERIAAKKYSKKLEADHEK